MSLSVILYVLAFSFLECKSANTRIVVPSNNNKHVWFPHYAGIAQNGNGGVVPIPPTANGDYQCVPSGTCPGGGGDDEIDIRIVTPVSAYSINQKK